MAPILQTRREISRRKVSLPWVNPMTPGRAEIQGQALSNQAALSVTSGDSEEYFQASYSTGNPFPLMSPRAAVGNTAPSHFSGSTKGISGPCFSLFFPTHTCNPSPPTQRKGCWARSFEVPIGSSWCRCFGPTMMLKAGTRGSRHMYPCPGSKTERREHCHGP